MFFPAILEKKVCALETIFFEQGVYPRSFTNTERIDLFTDMFEQEQPVDPIKVALRSDGMYVLIDGNHRFYGAKNAGKTEIVVEILDIDGDDPKELLKWAGVYNCFHGLPLTLSERKILVVRMFEAGNDIKKLKELLLMPERTLQRWTKHLRDGKEAAITQMVADGYRQAVIAQKVGMTKQALSERVKTTKDPGDIVFEKHQRHTQAEKMLKAGLEKKAESDALVAETIRENVRVLVETMASLERLVFSPQGLSLREFVREELFSNSTFLASYREITSLMPAVKMLSDAAVYLDRVSEFAKEVVEPDSSGDIDMLDPIWPLMNDMKKDIGKLEKIYSSSVSVADCQEDEVPDTRVKSMVDWYSEIWKGAPPEVAGGKKNGWGRVASIWKDMLVACDQQGVADVEAYLRDVYMFYKGADPAAFDKEDRFFLKDKVRSLVMLQGKYANIIAIKNKGTGNGHGKIKDGNGADVTTGFFGFPKHAIKNEKPLTK